MRCPFCGADDTQVKDSRPTDDRGAIRRRRFCGNCAARFTTFERVQLRELTVLKKNNQREPFDREKLARSIYVALRKRPVEPERVERMINSLVRQLESSGETEIRSPCRVAPPPSCATKSSPVRGAWIAAALARPSSTYAIATQ